MQEIKCKAMCVFIHEGSILVAKGEDPQNGASFYRPLGGSIEFGERSQDAIVREIKEEILADITETKLLGVLESLFGYASQHWHELVFIYDAKFVDTGLYTQEKILGQETDGLEILATWEKIDCFLEQKRLVPEGLFDLLTEFN